MTELSDLFEATNPQANQFEFHVAADEVLSRLGPGREARRLWDAVMARASRHARLFHDSLYAHHDYKFAANIAAKAGLDPYACELVPLLKSLDHAWRSDFDHASHSELRRVAKLLAEQDHPRSCDIACVVQARAQRLEFDGCFGEAASEYAWAAREWRAAGEISPMAYAAERLGQLELLRHRFEEAALAFAGAARYLGARPRSGIVNRQLLSLLCGVSEAHRHAGDPRAAEEAAARCLVYAEQGPPDADEGYGAERRRDMFVSRAHNALGLLRWRAGERSAADEHFETARCKGYFAGDGVVAEERQVALAQGDAPLAEGSPGDWVGIHVAEGTRHDNEVRRLWRHPLPESPWSPADRDRLLGPPPRRRPVPSGVPWHSDRRVPERFGFGGEGPRAGAVWELTHSTRESAYRRIDVHLVDVNGRDVH